LSILPEHKNLFRRQSHPICCSVDSSLYGKQPLPPAFTFAEHHATTTISVGFAVILTVGVLLHSKAKNIPPGNGIVADNSVQVQTAILGYRISA
jgi:hypothetical protein